MDKKGEGFESFYYFFFILLIYFLTFLRKKLQKKRYPPSKLSPPQSFCLEKNPPIRTVKKGNIPPSASYEIIQKPMQKRRRPRIVKIVRRLHSKKDLILLSEVLSINSEIK